MWAAVARSLVPVPPRLWLQEARRRQRCVKIAISRTVPGNWMQGGGGGGGGGGRRMALDVHALLGNEDMMFCYGARFVH